MGPGDWAQPGPSLYFTGPCFPLFSGTERCGNRAQGKVSTAKSLALQRQTAHSVPTCITETFASSLAGKSRLQVRPEIRGQTSHGMRPARDAWVSGAQHAAPLHLRKGRSEQAG